MPAQFADDDYDVYVNPTGKFVIGGPHGDTRPHRPQDHRRHLRRHGPPRRRRVQRQGPVARSTARRPTRPAGWPSTSSPPVRPTRCEVQVAYAIGMAQPMSILVETFGTNTVDPDVIVAAVRDVFDLRPAAIVRDLDLKRPIYRETAAYGHFGRSLPGFTWEQSAGSTTSRAPSVCDRSSVAGRGPVVAAGRPGRSRRHRARQAVRLRRARRDARPRRRRLDGSSPAARPPGRRLGGRARSARTARSPLDRLVPLAKWSGIGPSPEIIDLAAWASLRWARRSAAPVPGRRPARRRCVGSLPPSDRRAGATRRHDAGALPRLVRAAARRPTRSRSIVEALRRGAGAGRSTRRSTRRAGWRHGCARPGYTTAVHPRAVGARPPAASTW